MTSLYFGHSISLEYLIQNIKNIKKIYNSTQIYITNPKSYNLYISNKDNIKKILKILNTNNIRLIIHGKLLYNFCNNFLTKQKDAFLSEIIGTLKLNSRIIIHQGKNVNKLPLNLAYDLYVTQIESVLIKIEHLLPKKRFILLENSCGQGSEIGYNMEMLREIYKRFKKKYRRCIGFCIDTCHLFVSGMCDLRNEENVLSFLNDFDEQIGLKKIKVIHLNDSINKFNSKIDRHGDFDHGYITNIGLGGSYKGIRTLLNYFNNNNYKIDIITETPLSNNTFESEMLLINNNCFT